MLSDYFCSMLHPSSLPYLAFPNTSYSSDPLWVAPRLSDFSISNHSSINIPNFTYQISHLLNEHTNAELLWLF